MTLFGFQIYLLHLSLEIKVSFCYGLLSNFSRTKFCEGLPLCFGLSLSFYFGHFTLSCQLCLYKTVKYPIVNEINYFLPIKMLVIDNGLKITLINVCLLIFTT